METRYPDIEVELVGQNGNAYAILGAVRRSLKTNGVSDDEVEEFTNEAKAGDYDHLLITTMNWVTVL